MSSETLSPGELATILEETLSAGEVATILGVSRQAIHQLDGVLQPTRDHRGWRVYAAAAVRAYILEADRTAALRTSGRRTIAELAELASEHAESDA